MDYKSGGKKWDAVLVEHGVQLQLPAYLNALRHWKNPREKFGADRLIPAGVFYVNLRGQFEGGKTRDEVLDAADARKLAYRHNGRFDAGVLPKLDRAGAARPIQLPAEPGRLAAQRFGRGAAARRNLKKCWTASRRNCRKWAARFFPARRRWTRIARARETPCEFCDYRAVCRIDPWTHQWRVLRAAKENPHDDIEFGVPPSAPETRKRGLQTRIRLP